MKKTYLSLICFLLLSAYLFAQAPQKFNYQAIARDATGNLIANQSVSFRISIRPGDMSGMPDIYQETHLKTTNQYGQATLSIGAGTVVFGSFSSIAWGSGNYLIKTEMDPTGGNVYVTMGTSQLLSVPYALYSNTAGGGYTAGSGIDIAGTTISNTAQNATHTGDATGGSALTVEKIQGRDVANTLPTTGQALKWSSNNSRWEPANEDNTISEIKDSNNDTKVQVEETTNEDKIRFGLGGTERWVMTGARLEPKNSGYSVFIGDSTGYNDDLNNNNNTFVGHAAGKNNSAGLFNTANGFRSLYENTTGCYNTANGFSSLFSNTIGYFNTASGNNALYHATGNGNTAIGEGSGYSISTGSNNIVLGKGAGFNIFSGSNNIVIGHDLAVPSGTGNSQLVIGASDLLFGDIGTKRIGLGTVTPTQKLELKGGNMLLSNSGPASELRFAEPSAGGTNYSAFKAQAQAADLIYTLPASAPTDGQVLSSTNSGLLSWTSTSVLKDANSDTKVQVEETANEDKIRFDLGGTERWVMTGARLEPKNSGYSVFIGDSAGYNDNLSNNYNTFLGHAAGKNNTSGYYNTANGLRSLYGNTTGAFNTANGCNALYSNTTGNQNSATGFGALFYNISGGNNTANGFNSLFLNTSGNHNTATGSYSLIYNTTGESNTANGYAALYFNDSGNENTANGFEALYNNATGNGNTANGHSALYSNITGNHNTANGFNALYHATGDGNTAIGENSGLSISTGLNNIVLGKGAGYNITSGYGNIVIGNELPAPSATGNFQVVIGASNLLFGDIGTMRIGLGTVTPTQKLELKGGNMLLSNSGTASELRFAEPSDGGTPHYTAFKAQAQIASLTYTLPASAPTNDQVLSSTSTGLLSWTSNAPDQTVVLNAGTGISTSGGYPNFLISNTLPDQTVALTGGTGIGTSGTYPNFTVTNTKPDQTVTLTSGTGIGTSGTYPNFTVTNTKPDQTVVLTPGIGITISGTYPNFTVINASPNGSHTGDATGSSALSVVKIQGREVANALPTTGQVLKWNGTVLRWEPSNEDTPTLIKDANNDTKVQVEETANEDKIHFDLGGTERWVMAGARLEPKNSGQSVFIGDSAGYNDDLSNNRNTFIGSSTGKSNTAGNNNTANGYMALYRNTIGHSNTASGSNALYSNTTAYQNVAVGQSALYSQSFSNGGAAWESSNVAIGYSALFSNQPTAIDNGKQNTATGNLALYYNSTGFCNTANGYIALWTNTTGNNNTAIGRASLFGNETGSNNTALGYQAGLNGDNNNCTFIGANSNLFTDRTNVTLLGYGTGNAQCTGDNQVLLGNTAVTQIRAAVTGITAYSDARYKTNVKENVAGLDFILKLKPVTYNVNPKELHKIWGTPDSLVEKMDFSEAGNEVRIGFVAQDVEKAAKESGFDFPGIDVPRNDKEVYSLRYVDFIMPMVKGMQEQQLAIDEEKRAMDDQKTIIQNQQLLIETLIKRIEQLENK